MSKNQPFRTFEATKKLNLGSLETAFAKAMAVKRDKIEPICSPKMYENVLQSEGVPRRAG